MIFWRLLAEKSGNSVHIFKRIMSFNKTVREKISLNLNFINVNKIPIMLHDIAVQFQKEFFWYLDFKDRLKSENRVILACTLNLGIKWLTWH